MHFKGHQNNFDKIQFWRVLSHFGRQENLKNFCEVQKEFI